MEPAELPFAEVKLSGDRLQASLLLPLDLARRDLSRFDPASAAKAIRDTIAANGVSQGIRDDRIAAAAARIVQASAERRPSLFGKLKQLIHAEEATFPLGEWVVVAQGDPAVPGRDGRIEFGFAVDLTRGSERGDDSMDFRDRGYARNVEAGQPLATLIDPEPGAPGRDVTGAEIPAREPKPAALEPGEGVESDGARFTAAIDGSAVYDGTMLRVTRDLEVPGDVGNDTGSIDAYASVTVRGSVTAGFEVRSRGSVRITGSVQKGARVSAAADVEVREGIVAGDDEIRVHAGRNLNAGFVEASRVSARGEVHVTRYVASSHIRAGGMIRMPADAQVRGSTLEARKGIVAGTFGAKGQTENIVAAGYLASVRKFLVEVQKTIKDLSAQRNAILENFEEQWGERLRTDPRHPEVMAARHEVGMRQDGIDSRIARLRAEQKRVGEEELPDFPTPLIVVQGEVLPKCRIDILGHHLDVLHESAARVVYYLDPQTGKLASKPLKSG